MEGRDPHVGVSVGDQGIHSLFHLGGGLVGEREGEDLLGAAALGGDQGGDPAGDDGGLAGAGAGDDQERAGVVGDGFGLAGVQSLENPLSPGRLLAGHRGHCTLLGELEGDPHPGPDHQTIFAEASPAHLLDIGERPDKTATYSTEAPLRKKGLTKKLGNEPLPCYGIRYFPFFIFNQHLEAGGVSALKRRRVVITGLGVVAPNGIGKDAFWQNLIAGKSAVDWISAFDPTPYPCKVAAEVRNFNPTDFISARKAKMMGRFSQFAVAATRLAIEDAGFTRKRLARAAICLGTAAQGIGDLGEAAHQEFLSRGWKSMEPSIGIEYTAHAATAHVQEELEVSGPTTTIASACCTGIDSIAWGVEQIRAGVVDVALVGATEAPISEFIFSTFILGGYLCTWEGLPSQASRPYDLLRSGLVLSEGGAVLILEELDNALDRDASVYAEVLGYGSASEANGGRRQEKYVAALEQAIRTTLQSSHLTPLEIDYICAHANSTKFDDKSEAAAHRAAFGSCAYRIPISSIKSMLGQPFAASGVMQAVATTLAIQHQVVPPTINYEVPDPECDLDYVPNRARMARIRRAIFHSHSLGGHLPGSHAAMAVGRLE